jgi:hypothetical protein
VLSYLIWVEGLSRDEAIGLIHGGRPGAVPAWEAHHGCREDLVGRYRPHIEERAYVLSQSRPTEHGDAQQDWRRAESEVIRSALTAIDPLDDANGG